MFYRLDDKIPVLCTAEELGIWMEKNNRTIGCKTRGDITISTVFLGMDHSGGADPLLFETIIFKDREPIWIWRYPTWEDAEKGHEQALARYLDDGAD